MIPVYVVRRLAMDGEIDEIVGICKSEADARSTMDGFDHLTEVEAIESGADTDHHDVLEPARIAVFSDHRLDGSESVWIEVHNLT